MKRTNIRRPAVTVLALILCAAMLLTVGCGNKPAETTKAPATEAPSTEAPSTEAPSTEAPSTEAPSTEAPSTEAPSTEAPSTEAPATEAPATEAPETQAPETQAPATEAPGKETTEAPETQAPETQAPSTEAPSTEAPSTEAPATEAPATEAPETEAPETEAFVEYTITYDLDGGIDGGNPTVYSRESVIFDLAQPIKPGYDFAGWVGTGLTEPTKTVCINYYAGTRGDLSFKATWTENKTHEIENILDETYFGQDDGLVANTEELGISTPDRVGGRGEGIFTIKTVYTDITVDGVMDPAYTYGLHFEMDIPSSESYYADRETTFDVYMIRGQDGFIYVYIEVIDPDIVVEKYIFENDGEWRIDSIDMYVERGNYGQGYILYSFVPDITGELKRRMPENHSITLTEKGYIAEFALDNEGMPFFATEELGFGFYLNDANDWNAEEKTYIKHLGKNSSVLNPVSAGYLDPSPQRHDAVRASLESATGNVKIEDDSIAKSGDMLVDIANGSASVAIVYDENATAQTLIMVKELSRFLHERRVDAYTVNESVADIGSEYDYKILINMTSEQATHDLIASLKLNEYGVAIVNTPNEFQVAYERDTIVAVGWNEEAAQKIYEILYEIMDHGMGGGSINELGELYRGKLDNLVGDKVPVLEGFESITDVGEDAYMMYVKDSTLDAYKAYVAELEAAGFTLHTTNTIATAQFATYYNEDTVVNVQYGGDNDRSVRVVVDPLENAPLPMLEAPEDAGQGDVPITVTQMYPHNLCLVVQLSNGHFIIVDSGNNGTQRELSDFLREMAPDGRPVVEAWIMTHFHQDHIGGFVDYVGISSLMRYITIKSVIYNYPQWQALNTASSNDINNLNLWYNNRKPSLEEKGTTFYQARTGQKFYFDSAVVEILWTYEDIMPFNIFTDITNHTCIGFTIEVADTKIMVTGDSTEAEFRVAANKYGEDLKSDMVQLAHHGSGNGGGSHGFYKLVDAPVVFHSRPHSLDSSSYAIGPNEMWAIENCEIVIRSGNYGIATLTLPYTFGDVIESSKVPVFEHGDK